MFVPFQATTRYCDAKAGGLVVVRAA